MYHNPQHYSVCNVWDAHMGSVILMTATAVPFYYSVHTGAEARVTFSAGMADQLQAYAASAQMRVAPGACRRSGGD